MLYKDKYISIIYRNYQKLRDESTVCINMVSRDNNFVNSLSNLILALLLYMSYLLRFLISLPDLIRI